MARYKLDTNMAGAFLNLYQPIGDDCFGVRSLEPDDDLYANHAYILRACEYCRETDNTHEYVTVSDMTNEVNKFILKHTKRETNENNN